MKKKELFEIRQAIADYISTKECDWCQGDRNREYTKRLAKLLKVPMYSDQSGFNFHKFRSKD